MTEQANRPGELVSADEADLTKIKGLSKLGGAE